VTIKCCDVDPLRIIGTGLKTCNLGQHSKVVCQRLDRNLPQLGPNGSMPLVLWQYLQLYTSWLLSLWLVRTPDMPMW